MKKTSTLAAAFLALCFQAHPAQALYMSGEDLLAQCESKKKEHILSCMGYVAAVIDYQTMMQSLGTEPSIDFCLPEKLPLENAAGTVLVYLKKQRQLDTFIAAPSVAMALHQAYPCAKSQPRKKKRRHG